MLTLYFCLLLAGVCFFLLHFYAQFSIANLMRTRHPNQWKIITEPDGVRLSGMRVWMNLQVALRSPILPALDDASITRWRQVWRYCPWFAWLCWFGALGLQVAAR